MYVSVQFNFQVPSVRRLNSELFAVNDAVKLLAVNDAVQLLAVKKNDAGRSLFLLKIKCKKLIEGSDMA